ncbi:hypothetical protein ACS0TY_009977 [Phlomoides rotata]
MDLFFHAKSVRLKNCHDKFLTAEEDEETVTQSRDGSSKAAKWAVEYVGSSDNFIRLKSCYGKYLTASNQPFLLGMTGRKVLQTVPTRLDGSVEWEPVRERGAVKLKTRYGQFLRANGGLPPWRNSVTHDIPHRTSTKEWVQWEVHTMEILSPAVRPAPPLVVGKVDSFSSEYDSPVATLASKLASFSRQEPDNSLVSSPPKGSDGRQVYFYIADENGEIDEGFEELCITFKGYEVDELRTRLEDELGIDGISVCGRFNGKLYPLRLQLPPNTTSMHVVVVPPSSQGISSY